MKVTILLLLTMLFAAADASGAGRLSRRERRREQRRAARKKRQQREVRANISSEYRDTLKIEAKDDEDEAKSGLIEDRKVDDRRLRRGEAEALREEAKAPAEKLRPTDLRAQTAREERLSRAEERRRRIERLYQKDTITIILDF
jgi:hypothetical protein